MSSAINIVELQQVEKKYQGVSALNKLNLEIREGEVLGLFGHNGAGKTTTIKLILGLIGATSGQVKVFGEDPTQSEARNLRRKLGFLQENVSFYDQLTGLEVLQYFARLKGVSKKNCLSLLDQVGLSQAGKRRVKTYSKGMRQRLGLAQALLGEPKLLLLDEPTVGLDPIATQDFYRRIEQLKEQGCTVILCSHVLPGVEKYIDRALILGQGNLLAEGSINDLRHQADLPATFHLQGSGLALPDSLAAKATHDELGTRLDVPLTEKMSAMQQLVGLQGLENLDIHLPSLEDLYTHFIESHTGNGVSAIQEAAQ
ncbi:ABC transporter ATP-binding protein [Amphritea balenae]|uniref:ABC transporter ATP-binding protein n=1 Tax=Amphritea balenae TaxID=452629 RepID=A0A3P1SS20_9GAMM|nr:ABC transporter ATP-binding protein [Amphritea balenae]RRC99937.1 ABC transporter ATP-binding protein [Amphritea balenae]GGK75214.1 copper ABC transporter ATP-binding protein [Amphritea balenae]